MENYVEFVVVVIVSCEFLAGARWAGGARSGDRAEKSLEVSKWKMKDERGTKK